MKLKGKIKELTALTSAICTEYNGFGCYWNKNKLCSSFY